MTTSHELRRPNILAVDTHYWLEVWINHIELAEANCMRLAALAGLAHGELDGAIVGNVRNWEEVVEAALKLGAKVVFLSNDDQANSRARAIPGLDVIEKTSIQGDQGFSDVVASVMPKSSEPNA